MFNPLKIFGFEKDPVKRKKNQKHLILAIISGVMLGLSYAPYSMNFLAFFAIIPLFFIFDERDGFGEINRSMYLTVFIWSLIDIYWVGSWTPEADPFLMISGVLLLFAHPAVYLVISSLYYFSSKLFSKRTAFFLIGIFWICWEYVFSIIDIKFPWLMLANSQTNFKIFIQFADLFGAYGVSLLIILINLMGFFVLNDFIKNKKFPISSSMIYLTVISLPLIYGLVRLGSIEKSYSKIKVGCVQPDLNPWKKWEEGNINKQLEMYLEMSDSLLLKGAKLIVWPETALPVYLLDGSYEAHVRKIQDYVNRNEISLITGMPHANFYREKDKNIPKFAKKLKSGNFYTSYNSSLAFVQNSDSVQQYGKIKLVPFGERIPWLEILPILGKVFKWNVGISSWNIGQDTTVFKVSDRNINYKAAGLVCIESIYPSFVSTFVKKGAQLITIVTNDSWYGDSPGPYQHKEISVLRAIENRRYVVQAANGGISYIINSKGEIVSQSKMFERTTLLGVVELLNEKTFFTEHPMILPYLSCAISLWIFGMFFISKLKLRMEKFKA